MLTEAQTSPRQKLTPKKIKKYRRDMRWLSVLVHGANLSSEKEFGTRGKRINVWSGQNPDSAGREKAANVAQETDGTLHMLDDFNGSDKVK